MSMILKTL